jgi:ferredoxin-NADP reductase/Na+-translocating ferredoxin:NAD+ oxidoreductase RnfD subunit
MLKPIDYLLDRITMYRLVLYYLIALVGIAVVLCFFGYLPFNPFALAFSAGYLTIICWLSNKVFASVFKAPVNVESVYITALILVLIVNPLKIPHDIIFLTAVAGLAIASKFILAIRKKHIFNPVAVAVALTAFGAGQSASWWIGSVYMLPFVVIGGLLIVRKIHRGSMVMSFFAAVAVSTVVATLLTHHSIWASLQKTTLHSSLFFLAFVMLTEPLTSPATKSKQAWYGALAGLIFPPQVHLLSVYSTPELSLLVANVFSYAVSPKLKLTPQLVKKQTIAPDIMDFVFKPERPFAYKPGQYLELTLPHQKPDSRGNRRYFTLASSPTEENIRLGVKFYTKGSSFKKAMKSMDSNTQIAAGQLGGDFVLPTDRSQKLVFIAGGIGVTPYRSMLKYLLDTNDRRSVTMFYSEKTAPELVYTDVFAEATRQLGTKMVYTLTNSQLVPANWGGKTGYVSARMMTSEVPDYQERLFYISGSQSMVTAVQDVLLGLGVARSRIKTDYFPGYA